MSRLQELIDESNKDNSLMEKVYGSFPVGIAKDCGIEEVIEIIKRLDELSEEKEKIESWDGDSMDDIWRVQNGFSELLEKILPKYASEVIAGLKSNKSETQFYISYALLKSPTTEAISPLAEYLLNDIPQHQREIGESALKACKNKRGILTRLFGKNA